MTAVEATRHRADQIVTRLAGWAPLLADAAFIVGFVAALALVTQIHGFYWNESQPLLQTILDAGAIQCLHNEGLAALSAKCTTVGQPLGLTFLTGMPEIMLGWLISWIPGVDSWMAHQVLNVILDGIALGGGYLLLRRWQVIRPFALVASAAYLISPSIIGVNGFLYTFTGYTFLPLYFWLALLSLDAFEAERWRRAVLIMTGTIWLMVFTDGYSYATALLLIGVTGLWWAWRNHQATGRAKILAAVTFILANGAGVYGYEHYVNAPTTPTVGLGAFRFLGLDPITLFIPPPRLFWPSKISFTPPTLHLWGDGSNITHNYLGFGMLGLVVWLFVLRRLRSMADPARLELVSLCVGSLIALILSLGPALKLDSHKIVTSPPSNVPTSDTIVGLPTAFLYAHFPPFNAMRASFRWAIGLRFFVVFAAAVALSLLWHRGKRLTAVILLILAVIEIAPSPAQERRTARGTSAALHALRSRGILAEFDKVTHPGERVLMVPSSNDFLANALAPFAKIKTYNVGIDKSLAATKASWPASVRAVVAGFPTPTGEPDKVAAVLQGGADVVMISYVNLLQGARSYPAVNTNLAMLHAAVEQLAADPRLSVHVGQWLATVRLTG